MSFRGVTRYIIWVTLKCLEKKLTFDFHPSKAKIVGAVNSILGKIGFKTSLNVSLTLLFTKCVPILLYRLEALDS